MESFLMPSLIVTSAVVVIVLLAAMFRIVVPTNDVHIVQSAKKTISFGKDMAAGNTYYKWPAWIPIIGVMTTRLPLSVFDLHLADYAAYDKGRVPFIVDIMAFFRITEPNIAAERVASIKELDEQLDGILKSAARAILATSEIEEILEGRSKFGEMFTIEVNKELLQWGVQTVKNIEFMDIRDANGSQVIGNIMAKKKSQIEMESRVAVAKNMQTAQVAEIDAQRTVKTQEQDALQLIGVRTAEKDQQIGISTERAKQAVLDQAKETTTKQMAVRQVEQVRAAEIAREVQVVQADQQKQVSIVEAEGTKQQTILVADGNLEAAKREAEATQTKGLAKAEAEKAMQLAPVQAQITLAKEIGENQGYQTYLIQIRQIEAGQVVGVEQAKALVAADVKIISNAGNPVEGAKTVMDLFSPKGGTQLGAMVEAFAQSDVGAAILAKASSSPRANGQAKA